MADPQQSLVGEIEATILKMISEADKQTLDQEELMKRFKETDPNVVVMAINSLTTNMKVKLMAREDQTAVFVLMSDEERAHLSKFAGLAPEAHLVYQVIEDSGRKGIWTKDIKFRTGLHKTVMEKQLQKLSKKKLVKMFKPPNSKVKRLYICYDLEPDVDETLWYHQREFDDNMVTAMVRAIRHVINNNKETDHKGVTTGSTLEYVHKQVLALNVFAVDVSQQSVAQALDAMLWDGVVDCFERQVIADDGTQSTKRFFFLTNPEATEMDTRHISGNEFVEYPCGSCPVFDQCSPDGVISPANCVYFAQFIW